jgi:cell division protein FtsI/penicillin-binding protein 2
MSGDDYTKYRIYTVMAVLCAAGLVLVGQLVRWQIIEHPHFSALAEAEHRDELVIPPHRGEIRDRTGHLLAADVVLYDISVSPKIISDPQKSADRLSRLLNVPRDELLQVMTSDKLWVPIAYDVSQSVGETLAEWDIVGVTAEARTRRVYPEESMAAHILGFVNDNGNGFYGVEGYYHNLLRGNPGLQAGERSPFGDMIPLGVSRYVPPVRGATIYLTIDRNVQFLIERELVEAVRGYGALRGSVVVLDPKTGALLGAASYPAYNPNDYATSDERLFFDPVISEQYEPGSVFKMITMAAGLDANVVAPNSGVYDGGSIEVGGRIFYNWDRQGHGNVDMIDVLAQSLNVGIAQVALRLGKDRFYTYVKRFGFGRLTEVDLGSEGPGTLKTPKNADWHASDLGANSFGQGIAVTPLQMAVAVGAIANEGQLMKPYVVERIVSSDQDILVSPTVARRAISKETAQTLTNMLVEALDRAEAEARVPGYQVAGKTGTAEIPIPGGYHPSLTLTSFAGYLPADDPQVVVLVIIDRPTVSRWGSKTAAPTFKRIAEQLVILLDIPPDNVRLAQTQ